LDRLENRLARGGDLFAHQLGRRGIVRNDGVGDQLGLCERTLDTPFVHHRDPPQPADRPEQAMVDPFQGLVPRKPHHERVESIEGVDIGGGVAVRDRAAHRLDGFLDLRRSDRRDPCGDELGCEDVERFAHRVNFVDVALADRTNERAEAWKNGDQTLTLELAQRLTDRGAADAECARDLDLGEAGTGEEVPGNDRLAQDRQDHDTAQALARPLRLESAGAAFERAEVTIESHCHETSFLQRFHGKKDLAVTTMSIPCIQPSPQVRCRALAFEARRAGTQISPMSGARFLFVLVLLLGLSTGGRAGAQTVPIALPTGPAASLDIRQEGLFITAPVVLDGAVLFRIAAPATLRPGQIPIAERVTIIESVLEQIISPIQVGTRRTTAYDPATFRVEIIRGRNEDILAAIDAKHHAPVTILTVTSVEAQYNHTDVDTLAKQWRATLQTALHQALLIRQPAVQRRSVDEVLRGAVALIVVTALLLLVLVRLRRRVEALEEQILADERALQEEQTRPLQAPAAPHVQRRRRVSLALREIAPERRVRFLTALVTSLQWLLVLAWFIGVTWALSLFPQTEALARTLWHGGLGVATTWILAILIDRLLDLAITRIADASRIRTYASADERSRTLLRLPTITHAVSGFKTLMVVFIALLTTLSQIGVPVGSVVTIGGVAAIGVSLAAQNFVRDFLNGFLVLAEDQYVVGDFVTINGYTGLVEHLTLRMVQVRDGAGNLITIPHSSVTSVLNHSRNWSRVDYRVSVDPAADIDKALDAVRATIQDLARDQHWRGAILTPIEWIGIDSLSRDWTLLRASIRTAPLRQFELRREINARVRRAFRDAGIALGAAVPGEFVPPA
jgi:moderate conductance mechanosensitive channel